MGWAFVLGGLVFGGGVLFGAALVRGTTEAILRRGEDA